MNRLEGFLRFRLVSGVHISGERAALWIDKALVLDWHGNRQPILPATSLKGWLRENAERALRGLGAMACDGSSPATVCGRCPVCHVFGHPRGKSPLRFRDAVLRGAWQDVRMNVALSRYRKTAYEERLFSTEVAWHPEFQGEVKGLFPTTGDAKIAAALLWLGARMGFAIGAARSRGLGWLEWTEFQASVDGQALSTDELRHVLETQLEAWKGAEVSA